MSATLYYVHDPMCSWCWAFEDARTRVLEQLPENVVVARLLGGLAADTDAVMPLDMREYVQANWRNIEQKLPGVRFNYDFWETCTPRRATYPACRAVIAARAQDARFDEEMTRAIQRAYYREARNPSEQAVLIDLAGNLGLDIVDFSKRLSADSTQEILVNELETARQLNADSFPALVLLTGTARWRIPIDYQNSNNMLESILTLMDS
jgi:putative protein-disulfide isomerase